YSDASHHAYAYAPPYSYANAHTNADPHAYTYSNANAYTNSDTYSYSNAYTNADPDAYTYSNANTGRESDASTDRFAINTARSITAWKQAQDKGRSDPRLERCPGAIIQRTWHTYADVEAVGRNSGAISWRQLLSCCEVVSSSSLFPRETASRKLVVPQGKL